MQLIFGGNRPTDNTAHGLINVYIRLSESSARFYEAGRQKTVHVWNTHDHIALSDYNDAATSFEACITNMYRAATFMKRIRESQVVDANFKSTLGPKPDFLKRIDQIRKLRRAVHHLDEDILNSRIPPKTPTFLIAEGDIIQKNGHEIKIINRLQVGATHIEFKIIANWLSQMANCAEIIQDYEWKDASNNSATN